MRGTSLLFKFLLWTATVIYVFFQAMAMIGLSSNNAAAVGAGQSDKVYNLFPLAAATLLLLAGALLFSIVRRRRYIGIIVAGVAALVMLVVALDLGRAFPPSIGVGDRITGLPMSRLIWRHIGMAVVPLFMLVAWLCERSADQEDAKRRETEGKSGYDLSGGRVFMDLEQDLREELPPRRLKRSLRKRIDKEEKADEE